MSENERLCAEILKLCDCFTKVPNEWSERKEPMSAEDIVREFQRFVRKHNLG